MNITNTTRALVDQGMRKEGLKAIDLAKKIGVDRSWVTRFFKTEGGMRKLKEEYRIKLEDVLGIKFFAAVGPAPVSALAQKLDAAMEKDPRLSEGIALLMSTMDDGASKVTVQLSKEQYNRAQKVSDALGVGLQEFCFRAINAEVERRISDFLGAVRVETFELDEDEEQKKA